MGFCGGRTCKNHIDKIINKNKKISNEFTTMKVQPPVRPITFGRLEMITMTKRIYNHPLLKTLKQKALKYPLTINL